MPIPLEDNYNDVIAKVMRGNRLGREVLAQKAGVDVDRIQSLLDGTFDEADARKLAGPLDLNADALAALGHGEYLPDVPAPDGLLAFSTPYDDFHVNAYLVWDPASKKAAAFDTGSDHAVIVEAAKARGLDVRAVFVTHTHPDHIERLAELREATGARAFVSATEPCAGAEPIAYGDVFQVGALRIEARETSGHSRGGTSFVVTGLATPLVVVGDALFAGSMGGGVVSFPQALANNRKHLFTLADETIVCPGHGPLTTIGLEKANNPFYPEFQS